MPVRKKAPVKKKAPVRKKAPAKKAAPKKAAPKKKAPLKTKRQTRSAAVNYDDVPLRIITPPFTLSFPAIFKPKPNRSGVDEYKCTMYFDKDKSDMSKIEAAIDKVVHDDYKGKKAGLTMPIRDGDDEEDNYSTYEGTENCLVMQAKSTFKVGVVDADREDVIDPSEIYSGCVCRASITAYSYNVDGNKGISFSLNNIQKLGDGKPLAGTGQKAADEFEDAEEYEIDEYESEEEFEEEPEAEEEEFEEEEAEAEEELEVYENEDGIMVYLDEDGNEVEYDEAEWE